MTGEEKIPSYRSDHNLEVVPMYGATEAIWLLKESIKDNDLEIGEHETKKIVFELLIDMLGELDRIEQSPLTETEQPRVDLAIIDQEIASTLPSGQNPTSSCWQTVTLEDIFSETYLETYREHSRPDSTPLTLLEIYFESTISKLRDYCVLDFDVSSIDLDDLTDSSSDNTDQTKVALIISASAPTKN